MDPPYLKTLIFAAQRKNIPKEQHIMIGNIMIQPALQPIFQEQGLPFEQTPIRRESAENKLLCQNQGICIFVAAIFALLTFLWQEIFLCWKFIPFPHSMQKNGKMFQFYLKPTTIHTYRNCVVFAQLYDFVD